MTDLTRQYYQSDALRHGYQKAVKRKLEKILEQIELGTTLGQHVSEWHPDDQTRVNFNIQDGITGRLINVRVEHIRPEGPPVKKKRKITKEKKPYVWLGVAAINHAGEVPPADPTGGISYGHPIEPMIYGFDPEPSGDDGGYTWCNAVELAEGAFMPCWPECAVTDIGAPAECAGVRSEQLDDSDGEARWVLLASGTASLDGELDTVQWGQELDDLGGSESITVYGKVSAGGIMLTAGIGTQITAPDAAYDDEHPIDFWQVAAQIDPDGIRPNPRAGGSYSGLVRVHNDLGYTADVTVEDFLFRRPIKGGDYRFEIAALSNDCYEPTLTGEIKARLIVGKASGLTREEGDPNGEIDEEDQDSGILIVDFDCSGIGSVADQTVLNSSYSRAYVLGGAHLYSNDNEGYGQMPADVGFWENMILVNAKENLHRVVSFEPDFQPFHGGGEITFELCECENQAGDIDFSIGPPGLIEFNFYLKAPNPWRDHTGQFRAAEEVGWVSPLTYLYLQRATVQATCDGRIETVVIQRPQYDCGKPGYGEGMVFSAVGSTLTLEAGVPTIRIKEDGWSPGQAMIVAGFQKIFRAFPGTGEWLPNFTSTVLYVAAQADANNVANWSSPEWQAEYLCSSARLSFGAGTGCGPGAPHGWKFYTVNDAKGNLRHVRKDDGGYEWIPAPVSICYSDAARGFVFT